MLSEKVSALIAEEPDAIANLANVSALLMQELPCINWAGFYLYHPAENELVLGPFQGKVACVRIRPGRGVCGTAFSENRSVRVDNVHDFPGHIACDEASNAELVIPLRDTRGRPMGVLDLDSTVFSRFSAEEQTALEAVAHLVEQKIG